MLLQGVTDFELSGSRIAAVTEPEFGEGPRELLVKEGATTSAWVRQATGVKDFALAGQRIVYLDAEGVLWGKEGGLDATWVRLKSDVATFKIRSPTVAAVTADGKLSVMNGALGSAWTETASDCRDVMLSDQRVGYLDSAGVLSARSLDAGAPWVTQAVGVERAHARGRCGRRHSLPQMCCC